jgi:hypothetical protein
MSDRKDYNVMIYDNEAQSSGAKTTEHVFSPTTVLTTSHWERNRLLFDRTLLDADYVYELCKYLHT